MMNDMNSRARFGSQSDQQFNPLIFRRPRTRFKKCLIILRIFVFQFGSGVFNRFGQFGVNEQNRI